MIYQDEFKPEQQPVKLLSIDMATGEFRRYLGLDHHASFVSKSQADPKDWKNFLAGEVVLCKKCIESIRTIGSQCFIHSEPVALPSKVPYTTMGEDLIQ